MALPLAYLFKWSSVELRFEIKADLMILMLVKNKTLNQKGRWCTKGVLCLLGKILEVLGTGISFIDLFTYLFIFWSKFL